MQELAQDISASYVRADTQDNLLAAIRELPPAGHDRAPMALGWLFAVLAGLLVMVEYWPTSRRAGNLLPTLKTAKLVA